MFSLARIIFVIFSFFVAGALQGCTKSYDGEAFSTKSNEKFGGVQIYVLPKAALAEIVESGPSEQIAGRKRLVSQLSHLDWDEIGANLNQYLAMPFSEKSIDVHVRTTAEFKKIDWKKFGGTAEGLLFRNFYQGKLAPFLRDSSLKVASDSSGKFTVSVPENSVILAIEQGEAERVWLLDPLQVKTNLQLTENNLLGSACSGCLIKKDMEMERALEGLSALAMRGAYFAIYPDKKELSAIQELYKLAAKGL